MPMTPEEQEQFLGMQTKVKELETENGTLKKTVTDHSKTITDLQGHNQKLFLQLTTDTRVDDNKPDETVKGLDEVANLLMGKK